MSQCEHDWRLVAFDDATEDAVEIEECSRCHGVRPTAAAMARYRLGPDIGMLIALVQVTGEAVSNNETIKLPPVTFTVAEQ